MSKRKNDTVLHLDRLTPKQERFCVLYAKYSNATKALVEAGYEVKRPDAYANYLMRNPRIQERIKEHIENANHADGVTLEKVVREYARIAFCDLADFLTVDENGLVIPKPQDQMPKGWGRQVKKLKTKRAIREDPNGQSVLVYDDSEIELWPKTDALEKLGKYLGMFNENRNSESLTKDKVREILEDMAAKL